MHRDLKPANIKLTPDGTVKVLDFGLAKAYGGDAARSAEISHSPTLTMAATHAGLILGTAAYMSPEQAAAQNVDRRSDVWSFGVVLLELLTGRTTFGGETLSHTLASVLKEEPDWTRVPADLPPRIRTLIERCLDKKVRPAPPAVDRRGAGAARAVPRCARVVPPRGARGSGGTACIRRAALATCVALGSRRRPRDRAPDVASVAPRPLLERPLPRRLSIVLPAGEQLFRGYGSSVAIAPDGAKIAYVTDRDGTRRLYLRHIDQWDGTVLVEGPNTTTGPYNPFFSPDGQWIGFVTRTELKKVPVRGGSAITLCAVDRSRGASWGADGTIVFAASPRAAFSASPLRAASPSR